MRMVVHKYPLEHLITQTISIQSCAHCVHVAEQDGKITTWWEVDLDEEMVNLEIFIYGTGHEIPNGDEIEHIGTMLQHGGAYVWHVYSAVEETPIKET